nr:probable caffeoyl-CoA O-methyltransferase At4g26220 [Ipomoea batatas]
MEKYLLRTSVYPRESELLKEIRDITAKHPRAAMGTSPDSGPMVAMLLNLLNAKNTLEIGVFTGYSLLLTALTIPYDGRITAIDRDREAYDMGLPVIKKAGVEHKINFIESLALPVLDKLLEDKNNESSFDFAYVDADKMNYKNYHERVLKLLKVGGVVVYDNTLWCGTVAMPEKSVPEDRLRNWGPIVELNKRLAADTRVQIVQIPLGDGMTTFHGCVHIVHRNDLNLCSDVVFRSKINHFLRFLYSSNCTPCHHPSSCAYDCDFGPKRLDEFNPDVAEPAQANNADIHAGLVESVVFEGAVKGDSGAEQGRGRGEGQGVGKPNRVVFVTDHFVRVAPVCYGSIMVHVGVSLDHFGTVILEVG